MSLPLLSFSVAILEIIFSAWRHPLRLPEEALSGPLETHAWLQLPIRTIPDHLDLTAEMCLQVFRSAAP